MARILGILLVLLASVRAWAQGPADSWDNLKQLQAGQKIEVLDMNLKSVKGTFISFSDEAISLRVKRDEVVIQRADVLRVGSREGHKGLRNTLIGLGIGAGAGAGLGYVWGCASREGCGEQVQTLITFPVGAGIGALVGAAVPTGQTIYRAEARRSAPSR